MPETDPQTPENSEHLITDGFNFDAWAKSLGLNRKVIQCLCREELVRKEALQLVEIGDLKSIGLPLGSIKLIMDQVNKWNACRSVVNT
jgi:hypothetical protein